MKKTKYSSKKYWDNNIEKFGKFYASISEEEFKEKFNYIVIGDFNPILTLPGCHD